MCSCFKTDNVSSDNVKGPVRVLVLSLNMFACMLATTLKCIRYYDVIFLLFRGRHKYLMDLNN